MAKRYYWLKLPENFFRQKEIKKLRKIAGGDTYTIIYLKMLLLAMSQDNKLYFDGVEDNFTDELALELEEEEEDVQVTVQYLLRQGLMEIVDETEYLLTRCGDMTGSEGASAARMRKLRESKSSLCDSGVTPVLQSSDVEIEKEIDIDKDLYIDRESMEFNPPSSQQVKEYCVEKGYDIEPDRFVDFYTSKNWMIGKNKMKDWKATVRTWNSRNKENEKQQIKQKDSDNKFHNFEQRQYDYQDLERRLNEKATKSF